MEKLIISHPNSILEGNIRLPPSKSISNRLAVIAHLGGFTHLISNWSAADDCRLLLEALNNIQNPSINTGDGGTSFRFFLAIKALSGHHGILSGSEQFNRRPIGPLVDALKTIGADITYVDKPGFAPVQINGKKPGNQKWVKIPGNTSSQFISALLLVGPYLPQGLILQVVNNPVSYPYIQMTIALMEFFGIKVQHKRDLFIVPKGEYTPKQYSVEGDWSAAAFYVSGLALAKNGNLELEGLVPSGLQGDKKIIQYAPHFGVEHIWAESSLKLYKKKHFNYRPTQFNLIDEPDLAPAMVTASSILGLSDSYFGLQTLAVKESHRIKALYDELTKTGASLQVGDDWIRILPSIPELHKIGVLNFDSHNDHRLAMSLSMIALIKPISIHNTQVVAKSYPNFWDDLKKLKFTLESV